MFIVLGPSLAILVPCFEAFFPLGKIFELEPIMSQCEWKLLNLLEVPQSLGKLWPKIY
jgi:hypothetical protein